MGKSQRGISVDFGGVFELEKVLQSLGGDVYQTAVINALTKSKEYVNDEILKAMEQSPYNFDGKHYSRLKTKKGLEKVEKMDVKINGNEAIAFAGVSFKVAPELWYTAHGKASNPHAPITDQKLYNAVRVKGKVKEEVQRIQKEEFNKVIEEALKRG
jgi:hypothetical protein